MRNRNKILKKLGIRLLEINQLISEVETIAFGNLGVTLDMAKLTIMGHGFGGTTAILMASKDKRIKNLVTFDPWLPPLSEEILSRAVTVSQPHCSINSELFNDNVPENWKLLDTLFRDAKRRNA